ncbi:MAG: DUF3808 domain-containing protein [Melioribacteraceae bacterium]|nr:DUF3808 domain-containing protein [Melioribacteraceae bacterium]
MKRFPLKKVSLILLLINSFLFANPAADSLLLAGLNFSYSFELEKAADSFNSFITKNSKDPRGYHYLSNLHLWKYMGSKNELEYNHFMRLSDKALYLAEIELDENDESIEANYILGQIKSLRAVAFSTNNKALDAFWASKSSIGYFEDVLSINQNYYDAYLGLGMFSYALSFVPGVFNWALVLTGISGDKEEGLEYLTIAYEKGDKAKTEAAFHLGKIYTEYIADYKRAEGYLLPLTKKYQKNIMFLYQYAILKIRQRELSEAEKVLDKIIELNIPSFQQITAFCYFLKGDINYKLNDFEKALVNYEQFIMHATQVDYTGIANYRMAICSGMLGDKLNFQRHLVLAKSGNLDLPEDEYASEKSNELFDSGINEEIKIILKGSNLVESGKYDGAIKFFEENTNKISSNKQLGIRELKLAESYFEIGDFNKAIKFGKKALSREFEKEEWVYPFSAFTIAEAYLIQKNIPEAKKYLKIAEKNNDFEHKVILESRINYLKKKLDLN